MPGRIDLLVAVGADDKQPCAGQVRDEEPQQPHGARVGPLQVVEDHKHRLRRGRAAQHRGDGVEHAKPIHGVGAGPARRRTWTHRDTLALGLKPVPGRPRSASGQPRRKLRQQARQPGRRAADLLRQPPGADPFGMSPQRLDPRPEPGDAGTLPAAPPQHQHPVVGGMSCHVHRERGLADPRLPGDEHQPTPARSGLTHGSAKRRHRRRPPDEAGPAHAATVDVAAAAGSRPARVMAVITVPVAKHPSSCSLGVLASRPSGQTADHHRHTNRPRAFCRVRELAQPRKGTQDRQQLRFSPRRTLVSDVDPARGGARSVVSFWKSHYW
jgi:hypothetical protein